MDLADRWRQRCLTAAFQATPTLDDRGLVLGRGTVLLPFTRGLLAGRLDPEAHDRLLTLLAVAGGGRVAGDPCGPIASAMRCCFGGDRALAVIRLAFVPLPRLAPDDAYPLLLAEIGLEAGLRPHALLAELGYSAAAALLKGSPDQPRVPAGSGRASGQWTSGAGGFEISFDAPQPAAPSPADPAKPAVAATPGAVAERRPAAEAQLIPVFLDTERHGEDAVIDKPLFQPRSLDDDLHHGRPHDFLDPLGIPLLWPGPLPRPEPSPAPRPDDDDGGPACPPMRNDRGGGGGPKAQTYEALIAALVNPSSPTPKKTPQNPDVRSQAYYLPQPQMKTGEIALDDCKRTAEPSPIPKISKGDMVEIKSPGATDFLRRKTTRGYSRLKRQLDMQNKAILTEGKGRRLFWCVGTKREAGYLDANYGKQYSNTTFQVCLP